MREKPPVEFESFATRYGEVAKRFEELGEACHNAGPLDEKTRRLVKLGIAVGHRHIGAVHSAVRNAVAGGATPDEIRHAVILAVTTIGWPAAHAAFTWVEEALAAQPST